MQVNGGYAQAQAQAQAAAASALHRHQYSPQMSEVGQSRGMAIGESVGVGIMRGMGTAPTQGQTAIPPSDPRHPGHSQYLHDRQQQMMHQQYQSQQQHQNQLQFQQNPGGLAPSPAQQRQALQQQQQAQLQQQQHQQQQQQLYHQQRQQEMQRMSLPPDQNIMAAPSMTSRPPSVLQRTASSSKLNASPAPAPPGSANYRASPLPPPAMGIAQPMRGPPKMLRKNSLAPNPNPGIPIMRTSTLAANMALLGSGPITATPSAVGPALLKLNGMNESIGLAYQRGGSDDLRGVVKEYFTETGIMKFRLYDNVTSQSKVFEIPCSAFPRFQHNNIMAGGTCSSINPAFVREFLLTAPSIHPPGQPIHVGYLLKAEKTSWTTQFGDGILVDVVGILTIHFVVVEVSNGAERSAGLRIESFEFDSRGHTELITRAAFTEDKVEQIYSSIMKPLPESEPSPKPRKPVTRRKSSSKEEEEIKPVVIEKSPSTFAAELVKSFLPPSPVGNFGITEMGMRCLEIAESVAQLQDLIHYSMDTGIGPLESLARFTAQRGSVPPQSPYLMNQRPLNMLQGIPLAQSYSQGPPPPQSQLLQPNPFPSPSLASTSQNPITNPFYSSTAPPTTTHLPDQQLSDTTRNKKRKVQGIGIGIPRTPTPDESRGMNSEGLSAGSAGINSTPNGSIGIIGMNGAAGPGPVSNGRGRGRGR